jgi:hypothetical protein
MRCCWGYATPSRRQPNVPKCTELGTIIINDPTRPGPHCATATGSGSRMALPWLLDRRAASSLRVCVAAARTSTRYSAVRRSLVQVRDSISPRHSVAAGFKFAICQAERSPLGLMCAQKLYDALRPLRADRIGASVIQGGLPVLRFCQCVLVPAEQASHVEARADWQHTQARATWSGRSRRAV